jgi:mycofactocin system creatininase family protein
VFSSTVGAVNGDLARHTWPEVDATRPVTLVVPIGSCEQHGPHLPLDTDTRIATALAAGLVDQLNANTAAASALMAPALSITASGEHQGFAGTLSIGADVMESVIVELVRSATWADRVILVNGHGGNAVPVERATRRLTDEHHRVLSWWPPAALPAEAAVLTGDLHAGAIETSIMLALHPDLVGEVPDADGIDVDLDALRRDGVSPHSTTGVLGDPTRATAELGKVLTEFLLTDLAERAVSFIAPSST